MKKLKPMSLVKYNFDSMPKSWTKKLPFKKEDRFVFLGEVLQMPGHGIFINCKTGRIHVNFHMDEFVRIADNEA